MAADGSGSGFTKVTPVYTKPGSPIPVPFSVTGDVPPPAPLPLTGDETFTVYVDDIPMFATTGDILDAGVASFNGRTGAVTLVTTDITGAGGAPIDSPNFTGNPTAPTPPSTDNSNAIATTEFVTTAVDATFQDFLPITGGTLAGPGNLTVGGILSVTGNTNTTGIITNNGGYYIASSGPGAIKGLELDTGNLQRWTIFSDNTAELGANAGSNFQLSAYSDTGALLSTPISIQRSNGLVTVATGLVVSGGLSATNLALFSGNVQFSGASTTAPTRAAGDSTTNVATTAFVTNALGNFLPLTGGTLTGPVYGLTAPPGDSSAELATTAFVTNAISNIPPGGVTSFNGRTGAITLTTADIINAGGATAADLGGYLPLTGGTLTGPVFGITAPPGDNSTTLATTAFVDAAIAAGGGGGGGTGTVTSVGFVATPNTVFGVVGSPITSSGTINLVLSGQPQNSILAAPSASGGVPNFRLLTPADLPDLSGTYLPLTGGTLTGPLVGTTISTSGNITSGAYYTFGNSPANWYMWYDATATQWKFATPSFTDAVAFTAAGAITTRGGLTLRGNAVITGTLAVSLATTLSTTLTVTGLSALNGGATTITRPPGDNTTNIATTAFVTAAVAAGGGGGGGIPEAPTDGQIYGREGLNTSWQPVLPLTGGTLTGPLTINTTGAALNIAPTSSNAIITLNKSSATNINRIQGASAGTPRWNLDLGTNEAETGSNAGSNFALWGYGDNGVQFSTALLRINRSNQAASFFGTVTGLDFIISGTKPANMVWAGPASGPAAAPTWRALTAADIPGGGGGAYLPLTGGTLTGPLILQPTSVGQSYIILDDEAGYLRQIQFQSAGAARWLVMTNNAPESGANAGSDFQIERYDDTGADLGYALYIYRSNGQAIFGNSVTINQNLTVDGNIIYWGTAGWYQRVTAQWTFQAPNGSCYMDTNGNWISNAGIYAAGTINATTQLNGATLSTTSNANIGGQLNVTGVGVFEDGLTIADNKSISWGSSGRYDVVGSGALYFYAANGSYAYLDSASNFYTVGAIQSGGNITCGGGTVAITGHAATNRQLVFETDSSPRWNIYANSTAESGSNAGSDLVITSYTDGGAGPFNVLVINRATGNATFSNALTVGGNFYCGGAILPNPTWGIDWSNGGGWSETFDTANGAYQWRNPSTGVIASLTAAGDFYAAHNLYANGGNFIATSPAGTYRGLQIESGGTIRWWIACDTSAETGGNAGSNLFIANYADDGTNLGSPFQMTRATGNALFTQNLTVNGSLSVGGSLSVTSTISSANWIYSNNGGRFIADGPAADIRGYAFTTSAQWRWFLYADNEAETGGNAGSNLILQSYSDAGSPVSPTALIIGRATGNASFGGNINSSGEISCNNGFATNGAPWGLNINVPAGQQAGVVLQRSAGSVAQIMGTTLGQPRWTIDLGDASAESGSNAGSNFLIQNYADNGDLIGTPLQITRSNGNVQCNNGLTISASGLVVSGAGSYVSINTGYLYLGQGQIYASSSVNGGIWWNNGQFKEWNDASNSVLHWSNASNANLLSLNSSGDLTTNGNVISGANCVSDGGWFLASAAATGWRGMQMQTNGSARWSIIANADAESGGNAGSNLVIYGYSDAGAQINTPFQINRATGAVTLQDAPVGAGHPILGYFQNAAWYNAQDIGMNTTGSQMVCIYSTSTASSTWSTTPSDRRLKSNIKPAGDALSFIKRLAVYDLDFKPRGKPAEGFAEPETEHWPFSLIADEVGEVMPHAAMHGIEDDADQWVALHPTHLCAVLWKAVQELAARVEALEARA